VTGVAARAKIGGMTESTTERARRLIQEQYRDGSNLSARIRLHARFSTNRYGMFRWIFDRFEMPPGARVLELGTGTAAMWRQNAARIPSGWRIVLSDLSAGILREARDALASSGRSFSAIQLDAQAIAFGERSFDAVVANHMLYHVPDVPRALTEIRRVLGQNGACYAATFSRDNMKELNEITTRIFGAAMDRAANHFGLENGYDMMRDCFPKVELIRFPDSLVVTESQPLVDYVKSTRMGQHSNPEQIAEFSRYVESEIAAHGAIHLTKDTGILIARV
jgi:ubiquinone/menaquinone biosynthesis C-methylase UbiE